MLDNLNVYSLSNLLPLLLDPVCLYRRLCTTLESALRIVSDGRDIRVCTRSLLCLSNFLSLSISPSSVFTIRFVFNQYSDRQNFSHSLKFYPFDLLLALVLFYISNPSSELFDSEERDFTFTRTI